MSDHTLDELRQFPGEWRRRGLMPPHALEAMVAARLAMHHHTGTPDPTYADFFSA
ncbi:hypothetical protein [Curtobacterium sp. ISL-83]|uniref:hypothetical protein n=1 Tax=Curtobacterium sp. ISL-83 TaxID=2819145 RepID=UPI001BEBC2A6|nr:hypothetical protein [Curtobacterium sp. ISL-83]MBT2502208.1 hypothetical protein [Curtobacterium sp. ISL-83]